MRAPCRVRRLAAPRGGSWKAMCSCPNASLRLPEGRRMTDTIPVYRLYAIRYAWRPAKRRDHFMGGDPHEGEMPMDYFVWVAVSPERTVVIDIGFTEEVAKKRKRTYLRCPIDAMGAIGVDPATVGDVVISHLHYDHAGNFPLFPKARFHIQEPEVAFATGRYMRFPKMSHSFEV